MQATAKIIDFAQLNIAASEAVRNAIAAHADTPSAQLAEIVADSESDLTRDLGRYLALGFFSRMIGSERGKAKRQEDPRVALQQFLPGVESAPPSQRLTLSRKLPLKDGKSKPLGEMSVVQVRESIRLLPKRAVKKVDPMRESLQDLANKMSPYSEKFHDPNQPLSVTRYCEMKKEGVPVPRVRTKEQRSVEIKERWAQMTPKERSEIARKRMADKKKRDGDED